MMIAAGGFGTLKVFTASLAVIIAAGVPCIRHGAGSLHILHGRLMSGLFQWPPKINMFSHGA